MLVSIQALQEGGCCHTHISTSNQEVEKSLLLEFAEPLAAPISATESPKIANYDL